MILSATQQKCCAADTKSGKEQYSAVTKKCPLEAQIVCSAVHSEFLDLVCAKHKKMAGWKIILKLIHLSITLQQFICTAYSNKTGSFKRELFPQRLFQGLVDWEKSWFRTMKSYGIDSPPALPVQSNRYSSIPWARLLYIIISHFVCIINSVLTEAI